MCYTTSRIPSRCQLESIKESILEPYGQLERYNSCVVAVQFLFDRYNKMEVSKLKRLNWKRMFQIIEEIVQIVNIWRLQTKNGNGEVDI
jgi:hypothetical protein